MAMFLTQNDRKLTHWSPVPLHSFLCLFVWCEVDISLTRSSSFTVEVDHYVYGIDWLEKLQHNQ